MLILTRRIGETIVIGDDIRITVFGFNGSQIRMGISAPIHIPVHREEIYMKIQAENNGNRSDKQQIPLIK